MNTKLLARLSPLAAMALVSGGLLLGAGGSAAESDRHPQRSEQSLVGTWRTQVTLINCATGKPVGAPVFQALLTFARGGTATETTANSFFPALRSPGHGAWASEGGQSYRAATTAFISRDGILFRTQTITQDIQVDDDTFSSTATTEFFDPAGTLVLKGCAAATGERYKL